jgi:hypothetical protein
MSVVSDIDQERDDEPFGRSHLNRTEMFVAGLGAASSALSFLWSVEVGLGWLSGWAACQLNVAVMRRLMERVFRRGAFSRVSLLLLMAKSMVLLGAIWVLLSSGPADLLGFVGGFTFTLAGLVSGSVIFAPRPEGG